MVGGQNSQASARAMSRAKGQGPQICQVRAKAHKYAQVRLGTFVGLGPLPCPWPWPCSWPCSCQYYGDLCEPWLLALPMALAPIPAHFQGTAHELGHGPQLMALPMVCSWPWPWLLCLSRDPPHGSGLGPLPALGSLMVPTHGPGHGPGHGSAHTHSLGLSMTLLMALPLALAHCPAMALAPCPFHPTAHGSGQGTWPCPWPCSALPCTWLFSKAFKGLIMPVRAL